jgi:ABC-type transport system involved in cytochrome c biogenesis permease subunit
MSKFQQKLRHQKGVRAILITVLNIALPLLYFALVWTYGKSFFRDLPWAKRTRSTFLFVVLAIHFIFLLARTVSFGHPPVTSIPEILSMLAFSVSVTYSVIERRSKAKETGYFILNIAFFFQLFSSIFIRDVSAVPEIMKSVWFGLHVSDALLGYASITISAAYGLLYLMLYHEIKAHRFGVIYKKLPNLETLERMNFIAINLAFIFLSVAIIAGVAWLPMAFPGHSYADPKLIGTASIWLMYGVGIISRMRGLLRGRSLMVLSICAFGVAAFSMTLINLFFSDFHRFN